jgi:hypothetical protein
MKGSNQRKRGEEKKKKRRKRRRKRKRVLNPVIFLDIGKMI